MRLCSGSRTLTNVSPAISCRGVQAMGLNDTLVSKAFPVIYGGPKGTDLSHASPRRMIRRRLQGTHRLAVMLADGGSTSREANLPTGASPQTDLCCRPDAHVGVLAHHCTIGHATVPLVPRGPRSSQVHPVQTPSAAAAAHGVYLGPPRASACSSTLRVNLSNGYRGRRGSQTLR